MQQKNNDIDKQYNLKKFLKLIYREIGEEEHIRVFQQNGNYNKASYFKDIDEMVKYCTSKYTSYNNTYFTLASTDGNGGATENLKYRYCISFDFDKKDYEEGFNHRTILNLFKDLKIHYHAMIDTGNGYHVYVMINKTNKLDMVQDVQQAIGKKLKADLNAIKPTQLLRVPFTYNVKNGGYKMVKVIYAENRHTIRPYDIEFLYEKNCTEYLKDTVNNTNIKYTLNNTNIPICIQKILKNGSEDGNRYEDLQRIVVMLRQRNKELSNIKEVCKEWAEKSNYKDNLEYRVEHIYNNLNYISMDCKECQHRQECYSVVVSDFEYNKDDTIIKVSETHMGKLKHSNRKGAKTMKPNDLLVYGILKCHHDGLTKDELLKELTYTKKKVVKNVALSDKTLRETLKSLEDNGFIEVEKGVKRNGIPNRYRLKIDRAKIELTYDISFSATFECVKGNISTEELRLYNYMRYLHHKQQREDSKALKGNLFQINQLELAKELDLTQGRISQMIDNLLDEKLLGIWYREKSQNNGFEYNIYRLNY